MKYFTLARANIKSQKGSFIGILTLVFIITVSLLAVLSVWMNANAYENERLDRIGYGDITYWIDAVDDRDGLLEAVEALDEVAAVQAQDIIIFGEYEIYSEGGETTSMSGSLHIQAWKRENGYPVYYENLSGICETPEELKEGEIYVSPAFSSLYDAGIGDMIGVSITEGGEPQRYRIKGYFEDPIAGSALMGMKQALITEQDMHNLEEMIYEAGENSPADIARAHIVDSYQFKMERGFLNQTEYLMNVISEPEYYNILEGRTCLYRNELVMTKLVADELGAGIGDSVSLGVGDKEKEFIISGIYQCANDIGANFGVTKEGFESFNDGDENGTGYYILYRLQDTFAVEEIVETLKETYGERITVDNNSWSGTDAIVLTASALMAVMLVITVVFILVTVSMTGSKILYKEQHDLGIYKSLGFLSGRLRLAFAIRFGIVAFLSSIVGIVLSMYLTDPLANRILKVCGISHFTSHPALLTMLAPGIVVCVLFFAFAYLASGKIRKVEPGILIVE